MSNRYDLTENAVDAYEAQKVSSIFAPLAKATLETVEIAAGDRVLDVACGTGIMGRTIRERFGPAVAISGVDLSDSMVAKARALAGGLPGRFDWFVCDAADLPTPSTPFSHVFCQQGLQYFPDELAALQEMRRVLSGDGKLILTVWASANEYFLAQAQALTRHVGTEAGEKALAPFAYDGEGRLPALLAQAGFANVAVGTVSIERIILNAEQGIREDILGSPLGPMVEEKGPHIMGEVVRDILTACAGNLVNGDLVVPQHSTLIVASGAE